MQSYWKSSPYYLEMPTKRKSEENDIERYSDRNKANNRAKRLSFGHFLKLEDRYFPAELFQGKRKVEYNQSKGFSRQNKDQMKLDKFELYENLERKAEDQDSKGGNEKKKQNENENESDNEEPEGAEESGEESGDDYDKFRTININCFENPDDDEDEMNLMTKKMVILMTTMSMATMIIDVALVALESSLCQNLREFCHGKFRFWQS
ncbi:hypothetical protein C5167_018510 [Papaver somniferum]|uniref:Uncharacterized protein n=1 Tax=Papaver somniferum TaxID=3469 RepID=A0A4Y7IRH0_PAPSO|nr:hypothetical protein C5167_018510 [Papaver somniferum]